MARDHNMRTPDDLLFVQRYLRRLLEARNQHIKLEAEHPQTAGEQLR